MSDFIILWEIQKIKKLNSLIYSINMKSLNKYLHLYMYNVNMQKILADNYRGKGFV